MEKNAIEAEIAELTKRIEEKRRAIESDSGIVDERELVGSAVRERVSELSPQLGSASVAPATTTAPTDDQQTVNVPNASLPSYLDSLDNASVEKLNVLLQLAVDHGLAKALSQLAREDPFIVDAFHDAIIDRYYEELKKHGAL
ncbi:MAG: hypothetical protein COV07_00120 [Candidatus Vogelbacteria bacterium CG10_big_fil_rev_8_21_14_0_10_45_14]|uniref:Uncharacterized protein n=1 Tax=Candidatus Vogelbacteria bacterium CG10_big_fil_rev_8_21_14_0_10_45_14 TaxID=1975042 RepID=A0A2H0RN71_9BACT|nr:MAG: hypothetical protein COV07_00120 [Candidatus Vogelbacteria bacterium CG10_big_fil_rev_8_21_14_0_10_45_14]